MHDSGCAFARAGKNLADARIERLGKGIQGKGLHGVSDTLGDSVISGENIVGQEADGKDPGGGVSVYRHDRDKNIPAGAQLFFDIGVSLANKGKFKLLKSYKQAK